MEAPATYTAMQTAAERRAELLDKIRLTEDEEIELAYLNALDEPYRPSHIHGRPIA